MNWKATFCVRLISTQLWKCFINVSVFIFKGGYKCVNWSATYILWVCSMCWYRINQLFNWYPNSTHVNLNSVNKTQRHESTFILVLRLKNEKLFYSRRSVLSVKKVSVNETRSVLSVTSFFLLFCSTKNTILLGNCYRPRVNLNLSP